MTHRVLVPHGDIMKIVRFAVLKECIGSVTEAHPKAFRFAGGFLSEFACRRFLGLPDPDTTVARDNRKYDDPDLIDDEQTGLKLGIKSVGVSSSSLPEVPLAWGSAGFRLPSLRPGGSPANPWLVREKRDDYPQVLCVNYWRWDCDKPLIAYEEGILVDILGVLEQPCTYLRPPESKAVPADKWAVDLEKLLVTGVELGDLREWYLTSIRLINWRFIGA